MPSINHGDLRAILDRRKEWLDARNSVEAKERPGKPYTLKERNA